MSDCIFCKIVAGEIPSARVYEDELVIAIDDIHPVSEVHTLIIPKSHYEDILALGGSADSGEVSAAINRAIQKVAVIKGVHETGFRVITNCGVHACQSVPHLHYHILGGRQLGAKLV